MKAGDPIVGGTILRIPAIASPGYQPGTSGWQISQNGTAEFNDVTVRGTITGTNYELSEAGWFAYSGTPGPGNLIRSETESSSDSYGNKCLPGVAIYDNAAGQAVQITGTGIVLYTGSLSAGWTLLTGNVLGMANGWETRTGAYQAPTYWKNADGNVIFAGEMQSTIGVAAGATIAILPSGFYSTVYARTVPVTIVSSAETLPVNGTPRLYISPSTGTVQLFGISSTAGLITLSLEGAVMPLTAG